MAASSQPDVIAGRKQERLAFLMTPWVDKTIAVVALIPFTWLTYIRLQSFGFDVPRVALLVQGLLFIGTIISKTTSGLMRPPCFPLASSTPTNSSNVQTWSASPASIAGVTLRVWWTRQKL